MTSYVEDAACRSLAPSPSGRVCQLSVAICLATEAMAQMDVDFKESDTEAQDEQNEQESAVGGKPAPTQSSPNLKCDLCGCSSEASRILRSVTPLHLRALALERRCLCRNHMFL